MGAVGQLIRNANVIDRPPDIEVHALIPVFRVISHVFINTGEHLFAFLAVKADLYEIRNVFVRTERTRIQETVNGSKYIREPHVRGPISPFVAINKTRQ